MAERRYLVRLANASRFEPSDQPRLLEDLRRLASAHAGKVVNLRVSPRALEFDLFCDPAISLDPFFQAWSPLGPRLTLKILGLPPAPVDARRIVDDARTLFQQERYWEVHEVLEDLWKTLQGSERQWVQGLILAAAALVHLQRNETAVAWRMFEDALDRIKDAPDKYQNWPMAEFREQLRDAIFRRETAAFHR